MSVDILDEFHAAMKRTGWTPTLIAQQVHVTKSSVSHWDKRKSIPLEHLIRIGKLINDYRFKCAIAEYLTGVRVLSDKRFEDSPQARYFSQAKEEDDRKRLDPQFTLLLGKKREYRTDSDRHEVLRYLKELDEEIEEKSNYKAAILNDWGLTIGDD